MGSWILSLVGIITLGVLLDILIPEGQTNKYIRGIFSVITVFVIISPLPNGFKKNFNIEKLFEFENISFELDESFISGVYLKSSDYRENSTEKILTRNGYDGAKVKIVKKIDNLSEIDYVNINLQGAVIPAHKSHINIANEIKTIVADYLEIETESVRILYG